MEMQDRCPLCNQSSKKIYCKDCIRSGNFCHSKQILERYREKRFLLHKLKHEAHSLEKEVVLALETKRKHVTLSEDIFEMKENVKMFNEELTEMKETLPRLKVQNEALFKCILAKKQNLVIFRIKLTKIQNLIGQYDNKVREKQLQLQEREKELNEIIKENITNLTTHIFPITEIQPSRVIENDPENFAKASAIAEASKMTYIRGRWVYMDHLQETQYRIAEPVLPASLDYSTYNFVSENPCDQEFSENISAGLAYLTQLVDALAFYLDIILPRRLNFSDFCKGEMTEAAFNRHVMWLNINVIYLCLSQRVAPHMLHASSTIPNIIALLNPQHSTLSRTENFEISSTLLDSVKGWYDNHVETVDSGDESDSESEWEAVSGLPMEEYSNLVDSQAAFQLGPTGNIVSSVAASVFSLWNTVTSNKN